MSHTDDQYREAAKRLYHDEGTLEIDDGAVVSRSDDPEDDSDEGCYVQAWVWVSNEDLQP